MNEAKVKFKGVLLSDAEQEFVDQANERVVECLRANQRIAFDRGFRQEAALVMVEQNTMWALIMFADVLATVNALDLESAFELALIHMKRLARGGADAAPEDGPTLQ